MRFDDEEKCERLARNDAGLVKMFFLRMNDDDMVKIAESLETNTVLTSLAFYYCDFGERGALALTRILRNSSLGTLIVHAHQVQGFLPQRIFRALATNCSLETLCIRDDCIEDHVIAGELTDMLLQSNNNSKLRELELKHCEISCQGAEHLSQAMKKSSLGQLCKLSLGSNDIGDRGAAALASMLLEQGITHLNLNLNPIGDAGIAALCKALESDSSCLEFLELCSIDNITLEGARAISDSLPHMTSLKTLDLRFLPPGRSKFLKVLVRGLSQSSSLVSLRWTQEDKCETSVQYCNQLEYYSGTTHRNIVSDRRRGYNERIPMSYWPNVFQRVNQASGGNIGVLYHCIRNDPLLCISSP